jgi:hypothetical protein
MIKLKSKNMETKVVKMISRGLLTFATSSAAFMLLWSVISFLFLR